MSQTINTIIEDKVATVVLTRPEQRNALNPEMIESLLEVLGQMEENPQIQWLVLRGEGRSFCAGADIKWFAGACSRSREQNRKEYTRLAELMKMVYDSSKITIGVAHGHVMGGANGLLAACDFTIAAETTNFGFSEVKLGIIPATILPFVARRVSSVNLRKLMLSGVPFGVGQAHAVGLIDFIAGENRTDEVLQQLLEELRVASPSAQKACKQFIRQLDDGKIGTDDGGATAGLLAEMLETADAREGMSAFLEKRLPSWRLNG